jgi:hypothetical protein
VQAHEPRPRGSVGIAIHSRIGRSAAYSLGSRVGCDLEVSESQRPEDLTSLVNEKVFASLGAR